MTEGGVVPEEPGGRMVMDRLTGISHDGSVNVMVRIPPETVTVRTHSCAVCVVVVLFWTDCACSIADCPGMAATSIAPPKARPLLNNI